MTALDMVNEGQALKHFQYNQLLNIKTFTSDAKAKAWLEDATSTDSEKRGRAKKYLLDALFLSQDFLHGTTGQNGVFKAYQDHADFVSKASAASLLTHTSGGTQILNMFQTDGNELLRDTEWMTVFNMVQITNGLRAELVDVESLVTWGAVKMGAAIDVSPFATDSASFLYADRSGGGVAINVHDMRHPMITLNGIISALRRKAMDYKIDYAYDAIQAAITAAVAAGWVTNLHALGLAHTINEARLTLIQRLANKGYNISANQPVRLIGNSIWEDVVEPLFIGSWYPAVPVDLATANRSNMIRVKPNTVSRSYTLNLTNQLGAGYNCAALVVPGLKNNFCDFDPERFASTENPKTDSMEVIGNAYASCSLDEDQIQIFKLA